jgi:chromodomain-helicase-DNA-binding protein 1
VFKHGSLVAFGTYDFGTYDFGFFAGRTVLEGNKAGKEMFDKGELAAILRFGAANLFEEDKNAEVKQEAHERDEKLYNESIDAILARAEVVDSRIQVRADQALT